MSTQLNLATTARKRVPFGFPLVYRATNLDLDLVWNPGFADAFYTVREWKLEQGQPVGHYFGEIRVPMRKGEIVLIADVRSALGQLARSVEGDDSDLFLDMIQKFDLSADTLKPNRGLGYVRKKASMREFLRLKKVIKAAAGHFIDFEKDEDEDHEDLVFYAQKSSKDGWSAAFCYGQLYELSMTHICNGKDAEKLLRDPAEAADVVLSCWDEDWTD